MKVLAADVGGTHSRLAWFEGNVPGPPAVVESYANGRFDKLDAVVREFLTAHPAQPDTVCVGVAGPVREGVCRLTNLDWTIDSRELASGVGARSVRVINDLEAIAWGLDGLSEGDYISLNRGLPRSSGNRAVLAAGTGLGEAGTFWDGRRHHPFSCEGGHASFAPSAPVDDELLAWMRDQFGHVSWERLVSGMGILNLYRFLRDMRGVIPESWEAEGIDVLGEDAGPVARAAAEGRSPLCTAAMDMFARLLGAEAGNLALKVMARGGVYLAGGILQKNPGLLQRGEFLEAFLGKGRMRPLLEEMPVCVVTYPHVALCGAARCAVETVTAGR